MSIVSAKGDTTITHCKATNRRHHEEETQNTKSNKTPGGPRTMHETPSNNGSNNKQGIYNNNTVKPV